METLENQGLVVDSGFDYLTLTVKPNEAHYHQFQQTALDFLASLERNGATVKDSRNAGYDGFAANETFFGKREDGCIWRTSGGLSRNVAQFVRANEITPRVTRCDLQQTIEQRDGNCGELDRILSAFDGRLARSSPVKRQKFAAFYDKNGAVGSTFGARSSTQYLRCYRADLRHPEKFSKPSLRYECEWKADRAVQIWEAYEKCLDDAKLSAAFVGGAFAAKGMTQPVCAETTPEKLPAIGRKGSDEKTVFWIQNTVCKIIARLVRAGYLDELAPHIIAALSAVPESRELSASLESSIQEVDWEIIAHGKTHQD